MKTEEERTIDSRHSHREDNRCPQAYKVPDSKRSDYPLRAIALMR
ncbi:hypothetical protein [Xenorhabdus bovienii]